MTFDELLETIKGSDVEFIVAISRRTPDGASDETQMRRTEANIEKATQQLIAQLSKPSKPRVPKMSHAARKRKAFKHCVRLDANSSILIQVRSLAR